MISGFTRDSAAPASLWWMNGDPDATQREGDKITNHETALAIIAGVKTPMLGPSANFHGDATPYAFEDLNGDLIKLVDYVVPGVCQLKQASTVVDCSVHPYKIIRQGAVTL